MTTPPLVALVAVPFITSDFHRDLALSTLTTIAASVPITTIGIVNRHREGIDREWLTQSFDYLEIAPRNNLAAAWNRGAAVGFQKGAKYVIFANLDIVLHPTAIDNLVALATNHPDAYIWSGVEHPDVQSLMTSPPEEGELPVANFSFFMVDERLFRDIGAFDEQFDGAYHEDSDLKRRIALRNGREIASRTVRFYHFSRGSLKGVDMLTEAPLLQELEHNLDTNLERYKAKWGGCPGEEVFTSPYGR